MRILVAEDDATSRLVLRATLQRHGYEVTAVEDGRAALEAWRLHRHTLVISDWMMPELDGLALCRRIRADATLRYTYVVLLTSLSGKERYLDGIDAGADDFLSKPLDEDYLVARLHVARRILALHAELQRSATHDPLTGLLNRGAIFHRLERELARAASGGGAVAVLLLDIDHFKRVNDRHGHAAGDSVLRDVAAGLRDALGPRERVGRYGGEEFLVVVPAGAARAAALAETLRQAVERREVATDAGSVAVTISIGVATADAGRPGDADALVARADAALYRAKERGRNRVELDHGIAAAAGVVPGSRARSGAREDPGRD